MVQLEFLVAKLFSIVSKANTPNPLGVTGDIVKMLENLAGCFKNSTLEQAVKNEIIDVFSAILQAHKAPVEVSPAPEVPAESPKADG